MAIDARQHVAPAAGEHPSRAALTALSLSIRDVIPTASVTTRAQLITALTAVGQAPSTTNPVFVWRADAGAARELEVTTSATGATWRTIVSGSISAHMARNLSATIGNNITTNLSWDGGAVVTGGVTVQDNTYVTVPATGRYLVTYGMGFAPNATGIRSSWVLHQGVRKLQDDGPGYAAAGTWLGRSRVVDCAGGDQLSIQVVQTSGGALDIEGGPALFFTVDYQGPST